MTSKLKTLIRDIGKKSTLLKSSGVPFVIFPLAQWEHIEDILEELAAPNIIQSITDGRAAYTSGKTIPYAHIRSELGFNK